MYGGIARRNSMDSIGVPSVVSPCATVTATDIAADTFLLGIDALEKYLKFV